MQMFVLRHATNACILTEEEHITAVLGLISSECATLNMAWYVPTGRTFIKPCSDGESV